MKAVISNAKHPEYGHVTIPFPIPAEQYEKVLGFLDAFKIEDTLEQDWIPIYNILEATCTIVLAHPKYVKAIRGKKTDKKDAKWIADIFKRYLESHRCHIPHAHSTRELRHLPQHRRGSKNPAPTRKSPACVQSTSSDYMPDTVIELFIALSDFFE